MSGSNYSVTYNGSCATLFARIKGASIPLISSENSLQVESIYHNILTGVYENTRELCEDIRKHFSSKATMLVLTTLHPAAPSPTRT